MNFFEQQQEARSHTKWLIFLFGISAIAIIFVVNLAMYLLILYTSPDFRFQENLHFFAILSGIIIVTIAVGSAYKFYILSEGGISIALMLGANSIDPQSKDPYERKLLNIVEEMAIASGVPVPEVFLLENEPSINAFAAGYKQKDAVITVTQGAIKYLNRSELQGVIAHEFSHILNCDTQLNMRLLGLTSGISILAHTGRLLMENLGRSSSSSRRDARGQAFAIGLTLFILGWIGVFFARLIKAAISRQCEYLADASAVQFTRNPSGIADALKKIGGSGTESKLLHQNAEELSHFFFSEVFGSGKNWFSTHPPLLNRIRLIEPRFDGKYPKLVIDIPKNVTDKVLLTEYDKKAAEKRRILQPETAKKWAASIGIVALAAPEVSTIPNFADRLKIRARDPYHSRNVLYALFLSHDGKVMESQLKLLKEKLSVEAFDEVNENHETIRGLDPNSSHLAILNLCLPTVKSFSDTQFLELKDNLKALCGSDRNLSLLEYASYKLIKNFRMTPARKKSITQYFSLQGVKAEILILLSSIAYAGYGQTKEGAEAYSAATRKLKFSHFTPLDPKDCGLSELDSALDTLGRTSPILKQKIIDAAMTCALWDNRINQNEAAAFQVAAAVMGVPIPAL